MLVGLIWSKLSSLPLAMVVKSKCIEGFYREFTSLHPSLQNFKSI